MEEAERIESNVLILNRRNRIETVLNSNRTKHTRGEAEFTHATNALS
jgi:hypothetical protein